MLSTFSILGRRNADFSFERLAKSRFGVVTQLIRNGFYLDLVLEQVRRSQHPPPREIGHWWFTDEFRETSGESGTRQRCGFGQLLHRPAIFRRLMNESQRRVNGLIAQRSDPTLSRPRLRAEQKCLAVAETRPC